MVTIQFQSLSNSPPLLCFSFYSFSPFKSLHMFTEIPSIPSFLPSNLHTYMSKHNSSDSLQPFLRKEDRDLELKIAVHRERRGKDLRMKAMNWQRVISDHFIPNFFLGWSSIIFASALYSFPWPLIHSFISVCFTAPHSDYVPSGLFLQSGPIIMMRVGKHNRWRKERERKLKFEGMKEEEEEGRSPRDKDILSLYPAALVPPSLSYICSSLSLILWLFVLIFPYSSSFSSSFSNW